MQPKINHNTLIIENDADAEHLASIFGDLFPKDSYTYESHDNSFLINIKGYLKLDFNDGKYSLCLKTLESKEQRTDYNYDENSICTLCCEPLNNGKSHGSFCK